MASIISAGTTSGTALNMAGDTSGVLQLATNGSTTALTIDTSQNVGIGTTSPEAPLHIFRSSSPYTLYRNSTTTNGSSIGVNSGSSDMFLYNADAGSIILSTNATERMRIDSTGNVSITQTPGKYTVDISGGATSIANGGTVDFPNASGMLVVNNQNNGGVTIWLCGGGNTSAIGSVVGTVGSLAYNVGINGYRWTNNSGSTTTFGFFFVRTRQGA
jgi:hypothetical protein